MSFWPVETCSRYPFAPFDISSFIYVIRSDEFCLKRMLLRIHAVCDDVQEKDTLDVVTKNPWLSESGKFPAALEKAVKVCLCVFIASLSPATVGSCSLEDRCLLETK